MPIPRILRRYLAEHRLARHGRGGLFFGRDAATPFSNQAYSQRAARKWDGADLE